MQKVLQEKQKGYGRKGDPPPAWPVSEKPEGEDPEHGDVVPVCRKGEQRTGRGAQKTEARALRPLPKREREQAEKKAPHDAGGRPHAQGVKVKAQGVRHVGEQRREQQAAQIPPEI